VLVGLRANGAGANQWALIGGKPEMCETPEETIIREVKEEIGLDFVPISYEEIVDASSDINNPWGVYLFKGVASGSINLKPDEIVEIRYRTAADMPQLDFVFNHRELLEKLFSETF